MSKSDRSPYAQSEWQRWEMQAFELPELEHGEHILAEHPNEDSEAEIPDAATVLAEIDALRQSAEQRGYQEGLNQGHKQGHEQGFAQGQDTGYTAGHEAGYNAGKEAGYAEGRAAAQAEADTLNTLLNQAQTQLDQLHSELGQEVLRVAVQVASHVVGSAIRHEPDYLRALVQELLRLDPDGTNPLTLSVNPQDHELLEGFLRHHPHTQKWRLFTDGTLTPGGCMVRTALGDIDATLETRWRRAIQSLNLDLDDFQALVCMRPPQS